MKMSNGEVREKWIASEYVPEPQQQSDGRSSFVFGKLSGSKYQYELYQTEENKWKLWPVQLNSCAPIYGSTPKECLEAARKIDEPELKRAVRS
jgi:hypothetical protein